MGVVLPMRAPNYEHDQLVITVKQKHAETSWRIIISMLVLHTLISSLDKIERPFPPFPTFCVHHHSNSMILEWNSFTFLWGGEARPCH